MKQTIKIIIGVVVGLAICAGLIFGLSALGIGGYLFSTASSANAAYFLSVSEVLSKDDMANKQIRISGAVIGDSIHFDGTNGKLTFLIADVPSTFAQVEKQGGLAVVLENAVNDPNSQRIQVVYFGPKPDLLQNKAQAILTGELHSDGIFYADELLLKCPSSYKDAVPNQVIDQ